MRRTERAPVGMIRLVLLALVASMEPTAAADATAQGYADRAAQFAIDLSVLESQGDFDQLYP